MPRGRTTEVEGCKFTEGERRGGERGRGPKDEREDAEMSLRAVRRVPRKEITSSGLTPPLPSQRFLLAVREVREKEKLGFR